MRNCKFRWNELNNGINQRNFKGGLKVPCVNSLIKLHGYLTKGFEGGPKPLLSLALLGMARPKREIPNFAGTSLTKELIRVC